MSRALIAISRFNNNSTSHNLTPCYDQGVLLMLLLVLGCGPDRVSSWCGSDIQSAKLTEANLVQISILAGTVQGQGLLVATRTDDQECVTPVTLQGGMVGLAVDLTDVSFPLQFELPQGKVEGAALFGRYEGSAAAAVTLAGVSTKHLANGRGVEIDQANFAMGIGVGVSYTWLDVEIAEATAYDSATDSGYDTGGIE